MINRHRFNDSALYGWYLRLRRPEHFRRMNSESRFYSELLKSAGTGLVMDIGANDGSKAAVFLKLGCAVICVEPDVSAAAILRERVYANSTNHHR